MGLFEGITGALTGNAGSGSYNMADSVDFVGDTFDTSWILPSSDSSDDGWLSSIGSFFSPVTDTVSSVWDWMDKDKNANKVTAGAGVLTGVMDYMQKDDLASQSQKNWETEALLSKQQNDQYFQLQEQAMAHEMQMAEMQMALEQQKMEEQKETRRRHNQSFNPGGKLYGGS